jgi:hypothetical protein
MGLTLVSQFALDITHTCADSYFKTRSGLGPEIISQHSIGGGSYDARYILRPETVESIMYLWRYVATVVPIGSQVN